MDKFVYSYLGWPGSWDGRWANVQYWYKNYRKKSVREELIECSFPKKLVQSTSLSWGAVLPCLQTVSTLSYESAGYVGKGIKVRRTMSQSVWVMYINSICLVRKGLGMKILCIVFLYRCRIYTSKLLIIYFLVHAYTALSSFSSSSALNVVRW